ncbi:MAG: ECF transporter S component [Butyricicoccaceae bacterium]
METNKNGMSTRTLALGAVLTALVVLLQFMGAFVHFGPFSISLVLIPIVIGAAVGGVKLGAWLGLVFGLVVLASGDAAAFLAIHVPGTILTVLLKGTACGALAGLTYQKLASRSRNLAVAAAAVVCPVVNTGVFLLGCLLFFLDTVAAWGQAAGFGSVGAYMLFGLVGGNFLFELGSNIVLSPIVVRLLHIREQSR